MVPADLQQRAQSYWQTSKLQSPSTTRHPNPETKCHAIVFIVVSHDGMPVYMLRRGIMEGMPALRVTALGTAGVILSWAVWLRESYTSHLRVGGQKCALWGPTKTRPRRPAKTVSGLQSTPSNYVMGHIWRAEIQHKGNGR